MTDTEEKFSVYVVEDDNGVLKSLCALLNAHGYETIACRSAEEFLNLYEPNRKACMVLDLRLPKMNGLQLQAHLADIRVNIPIVVVTAHGDVPIAVQAMRAGAIDFIEKPARIDRLLEAVRLAGGMLFNRLPPEIPKKIVADRLSKLTEREREVLQHLLQGKLNKEIADALDVSQRTVEVHRSRIREKMQARGIADLIRMVG
ncbi:response regulator [uncultured Roseovarius sp.]|uniref:response regulator transcription factor n=1 Tax=uncultured Roseovarius sp. TaxID=293344 RepID=UPI0026108F8F|nr:response regulator [uncultured Roseovarius sp.]